MSSRVSAAGGAERAPKKGAAKRSSKIIVRNVPFEANKKEVRESANPLRIPMAILRVSGPFCYFCGHSLPAYRPLIWCQVLAWFSLVQLRELFASFGQLKSLRMPKKFDGTHR
jgi:hypothetical protein